MGQEEFAGAPEEMMAAHRWKKAISELRAKAKPSDYPDPEEVDDDRTGAPKKAKSKWKAKKAADGPP